MRDQPQAAGTEPMTEAQRTTLEALCGDAGQPFDARWSTAEAARRISELQKAKDRSVEAARSARGVAGTPLTSAAGEEDPGAALDEPKTKDAIQDDDGDAVRR